jgi:uncharacterized membrane protein YqjE
VKDLSAWFAFAASMVIYGIITCVIAPIYVLWKVWKRLHGTESSYKKSRGVKLENDRTMDSL